MTMTAANPAALMTNGVAYASNPYYQVYATNGILTLNRAFGRWLYYSATNSATVTLDSSFTTGQMVNFCLAAYISTNGFAFTNSQFTSALVGTATSQSSTNFYCALGIMGSLIGGSGQVAP